MSGTRTTSMMQKILDRAKRAAPFASDARGLMPLAQARRILAKHPIYEPSALKEGRKPEDIAEADRAAQQWAALLSLADAAELEKALFALTWNETASPYPGQVLVERYGAAPLMRFFVGSIQLFGMFATPFLDTLDILRAQGTEEAFDLMLRVCNTDTPLMFKATPGVKLADVPPPKFTPVPPIDAWLKDFARAHPAEANAVLARRVAAKDKRAKSVLAMLGPPAPTKALTPAAFEKRVLTILDEAATGPEWPLFATGIEDDPAPWEYFELRMLAVRSKTGDDWGIAFERLSGSYDRYQPTRVQRYLYGSKIDAPGWDPGRDVIIKLTLDKTPDAANGETLSIDIDGVTVKGPKGPLTLTAKGLAKRDLKPGLGSEVDGDAGFNLRLRAYIDAFPGCFFSRAADLVRLLGVKDPVTLCDTTSFAHAVGKRRGKSAWNVPPSKCATYRSLAKAIGNRRPSDVDLGVSNLDFRLHAVHKTR